MKRDASASRPDRSFTSLRGRSAFRRVYRTGTRIRRGGIVMIVTATGPPGQPRVGIVAGRNVGNAVRRNRARRRLRAALEQTPLCEDREYVVIASPEVSTVGFTRLVEWLRSAVTAEECP